MNGLRRLLSGDPAIIVCHARVLLFGGFAALLISYMTGGFAIIFSMFAFALGASAAVFSRWKTERGLWMLAALFFLMNATTYIFMTLGQLQDALRGVRPESLALVVDLVTGAIVLAVTLRFLLRVAVENYLISHPRHEE